MSRKEFDKRQARLNQGLCPRCNRTLNGWTLKRADVCSPAGWVNCIRSPMQAAYAEDQLTVKEA